MEKFNTLHYVLAVLKAYKIKYLVGSPGSQNSTFNYLVQEDPQFKCYSVVDERSAVYVACGIAAESQEPVVVTCTGATSARNYDSGLTEAYYSEIPIIALTFYNPYSNQFSMSPQYTDRSVSSNDIKAISVHLPEIQSEKDKRFVLTSLNAALSRAKYNNVPVHINCPSAYDYSIKSLPQDIWTTEYYFNNFTELKGILKDKKIGIFIGRHRKFTKEEENVISNFAQSYDAVVFCEHMSNYHGKNKILISRFRLMNNPSLRPEIILDLGGISCIYNNGGLLKNADYWSVVENFKYSAREEQKMLKLLNGRITTIFSQLANSGNNKQKYYEILMKANNEIEFKEFPISTILTVQQLAENIPNDSSLHLAILNAVNACGFFNLPENVDVICNAGGFGIDGPISTVVGQSLVNPNKKCFCISGDLAFFYDMNILGNRHINKNLRIIVVNNNQGFIMRTDTRIENNAGEKTGVLICAANHYKNGAKGWAESCDFEYMCAKTKDEFLSKIKDFCNKDYNKPVLFEVFTNTEAEKESIRLLFGYCSPNITRKKLSKLEKIFSIKNEYGQLGKHKVIRFLGAKIKIKRKWKSEKNK